MTQSWISLSGNVIHKCQYFDKIVIELQVTRLTKVFVQSKMAYLINIDNFSIEIYSDLHNQRS